MEPVRSSLSGGVVATAVLTAVLAGMEYLFAGADVFALAWPLLFAGFTWGIPGESGAVHGAIFGLVLFAGYLARGLSTMGPGLNVVVRFGFAYLVYGAVLGAVYDRLAAHRTLLETAEMADTGA